LPVQPCDTASAPHAFATSTIACSRSKLTIRKSPTSQKISISMTRTMKEY
jgi:hypothetical protein